MKGKGNRKGLTIESLRERSFLQHAPPSRMEYGPALEAISKSTLTGAKKVLAVLKHRGSYGATDQEMQAILGMPRGSAVAHRNWLMERKQVKWSGAFRRTASLTTVPVAKVWICY